MRQMKILKTCRRNSLFIELMTDDISFYIKTPFSSSPDTNSIHSPIKFEKYKDAEDYMDHLVNSSLRLEAFLKECVSQLEDELKGIS